jgi:L-phenylalanine/L-methionine N-acetyltransferase
MADAEEIVIRAPVPADLAGLTALANLPGVRHGTLRLPFTGEEFVRERFLRTDGNEHNLVALSGGEVVGQAALIRSSGRLGHSADVFVAVHDDHWGRGIGRRLMLALLELADDWLGLVRLQLTVNVDNARAIRLYESLGFEREGTQRASVLRAGVLVDALMMARLRPPPMPAP